MSAARRTALFSVFAATGLIALKLVVGLATNSLGLISEAVHSGTDLAAALLTFFTLGVAGRPADASHAWGHGKAEHLSALAESLFLVAAGGLIVWQAIRRLTGDVASEVDAAWYAFAVVAIVLAVDLTRMLVSARAAREHRSAALHANAVHFGADMAGTLAVLLGLILTRAGHPRADAIAALFVALLVLVAAARLARINIDTLMDRTPTDAERAARAAIEALGPDVGLERLRVRSAGGRHFVDAVIATSPSAALAEGHARADAVEDAVRTALPDADVVVHVEPGASPATLPERALAAALAVPGVREIHNVKVIASGHETEVSLHVKFPTDATLQSAHALADRVEAAIHAALPDIDTVRTHLEPLDDVIPHAVPSDSETASNERALRAIVTDVTGAPPREIRFVATDHGVVAFLVVTLAGDVPLIEAHERAGTIRTRARRDLAELADVFVHTEPA